MPGTPLRCRAAHGPLSRGSIGQSTRPVNAFTTLLESRLFRSPHFLSENPGEHGREVRVNHLVPRGRIAPCGGGQFQGALFCHGPPTTVGRSCPDYGLPPVVLCNQTGSRLYDQVQPTLARHLAGLRPSATLGWADTEQSQFVTLEASATLHITPFAPRPGRVSCLNSLPSVRQSGFAGRTIAAASGIAA